MPTPTPVLLRLPFWLVDQGFRLERVLASDLDLSWSQCYALLIRFELSGPEKSFAKAILRRKRNIWLYRCHQGAFAGDFALVDMSPSSPRYRKVFVVELKSGETLHFGEKGAGKQLANASLIVDDLREQGVADELGELIIGGESQVLDIFGARELE